ncbi:MAG: GntR family transcriptional regulator, transcriptional repressor for pyruvate dehydrogenase complex [Candidatus Eremiobacteraeota bacterium]|nr:GntR family transcriptional regulator, transcriptional repressor for pyruvate dehydrogenase complex [Candidatus Eremiobacteraeota bacterium]
MTSSRAAALADEIEVAIVGGEIASGDRLGTKDDLRRRFDVAYGTLNEALRILQQRGYVTSRTGPGGGLFATIPTSSDRLRHLLSGFPEGGTLRDCAQVRHALEEAVTLDATRARSRTDIAELRRILKGMAAAARADDADYLHENWRLHRRIAECCRNRVLANLYVTLLDANEPGPGVAIPDRHRVANAEENLIAHTELVDAIASGSRERARNAVKAHEAFFAPVDDKPLGPVRVARPQPQRGSAGRSNGRSRSVAASA